MANEEIPFFIRGAGPDPQPSNASLPRETKEGISGQVIESGGAEIAVPRAVSLSQIRTLDLICEGEIEGLVSGSYTFVGAPGEIGYRNATFVPYEAKSVGGVPIPYLRSIYWNETPVVDKDNLFNFQSIDVDYSYGGPNGNSAVGEGEELTISRNIQERLRGPNSQLVNITKKSSKVSQQVIGEVEQFAKYYRILNKDCLAANVNVRVNALSTVAQDGKRVGDTMATSITYRIYYKPLFSTSAGITSENAGPEEQLGYIFGKEETINGKISYGYIRSSRIDFDLTLASDPKFLGWAIKIFRITPDSLQGFLRNQTYIDSLTEIYGNSFNYPNSAIIAAKFNAEYFSQIPARTFDVRLLKVKIPSNYNPIKKTYDGDWDGSWKEDDAGNEGKFWTDNPAWCYYDLLTNSRYGLGKYIDSSLVDKWTLYEIAQYCDTIVADGLGGIEPRFTCNTLLNSKEDAYRVINDMASIFRAITYYYAGGIYSSMDEPKDPIYQFTNANVIDGNFTYSSSSKRVRHSVAIVRYNDRHNYYKPAVEYVEDTEAIKKYGYRELDVPAAGCTSRGQAIRYGRWALLSEASETETISFEAGIEASILRPGDVFKVFDAHKKNSRHGGRIRNVYKDAENSSIIQLDDTITGFVNNTTYNLCIITPTFTYEPSQIENLSSQDIINLRRNQLQTVNFSGGDAKIVSGLTTITINPEKWSKSLDSQNYKIDKNLIWTIEASGSDSIDANFTNQWEYYRIIRIEEKEDNRYSLNGLQYDLNKYQAIDSGLNFESVSIVADIPTPPENISLIFENVAGSQDLKGISYTVQKNNLDGIQGFLVYAKSGPWIAEDFSERHRDGSIPQYTEKTPDSRFLINILSNNAPNGVYIPLENGTYYFRAYSRNILGIPSDTSAARSIEVTNISAFQSLYISSLRLEGQQDSEFASKASDTYTVSNPIFRWQAAFENANDIAYDLGDLAYRISIRKSTNPNAINPASPTEKPGGNDPYQPSNVIYYQTTDYRPSDPDNPSYTFDLASNMGAIVDYYKLNNSGYTGILREYDVVVEAHLDNGDSSAGGNIRGSRGSVVDSSFYPSRTKGWDILYVNNPKVPSITLTNDGELESCIISAQSDLAGLTAQNKVCSEQWMNPDGTINLKVHTNNLPGDIVGGFIFSCRETFTQAEAYNGIKNNGIPIYKSEFLEVSDPILATSQLIGVRNVYIAASFYDSFDSAFKTKMLESNPNFNTPFVSGLNMSNVVLAHLRGISQAQGVYTAWGKFELQTEPSPTNNNKLKITSLNWIGAGVANCYVDGFEYPHNESSRAPSYVFIRVSFDTETINSTMDLAPVISWSYAEIPTTVNSTPTYYVNDTFYKENNTSVNPILGSAPNFTFEAYEIKQKIKIESMSNLDVVFKIRIPHDYSNTFETAPYNRDGTLKNIKTKSTVFIGYMTNTAEGTNYIDVSQFASVPP